MNYEKQFLTKMESENLHPSVCQSFATYYNEIINGATGLLSEKDIEPPKPENLIHYSELKNQQKKHWEKLVVIKLNGGLGTSMGLKKAKSLLKVKGEFTFLDIICQQILMMRKKQHQPIPLLFMNSFNTREDTLNYLEKYSSLKINQLPLDFLQNKFPKIQQKNLAPLESSNEHDNWNPPGHGEIYLAMQITGILEQLINCGYEYAFISNSDNLGAVADLKILSHFADMEIPFLMEVCHRTEMDKKGGHLAQTKNGQLILRELAQCPDSEIDSFQDIEKYSFFNTNNLWINLSALKESMQKNDNVLPLPLILNKKTVENVPVYQVESAMGAAIGIFEGSKALIVPRSRFLPVKKTNDLLALWSDAFDLNPDFSLSLHASKKEIPIIDLDENFNNIELLQCHFSKGIPSLKTCNSLSIKGDIFFGENVLCEGDVSIVSGKKAFLSDKIIKNQELILS